MKRIALFALMMLLAASTALAQGKFVTDFKGIPFGKDLSEVERMAPTENRGEVKLYKRYADDRTFQGLPLKELHYGFFQNKFCLAMFSTQGPSAYNTLKAYFDSNYGPARQHTVNVKRFDYTAGEVGIQLAYNDNTKIAEVSYLYLPITRQFMPKQ
ncbi:hypothetical protein [Fundidesulfovibrio agrisoli]|uniref:hypothetical protein n=1 Tax=Fundidesulfovibrio agrisoli TaxID=2922717 RepID=UPI001FAC96EF|nr:hypothetical protein [Fundidesulfovibrio agrisoli]